MEEKMNTLFKLLSGLILLSITGCDISNIDKPSLEEVYVWLKPRADFTEIGKALLECGMPSLIDQDSVIDTVVHIGATIIKTSPFASLVLLFRSEVSRSA